MKTVIKLLLGVGDKEHKSYTPVQLFLLGLSLLGVFFGSLLTIIFLISLYIR
tara:strand:- start:599 stop:754 length:156 start_codon:yes stop_codon:yes gene_type:complete